MSDCNSDSSLYTNLMSQGSAKKRKAQFRVNSACSCTYCKRKVNAGASSKKRGSSMGGLNKRRRANSDVDPDEYEMDDISLFNLARGIVQNQKSEASDSGSECEESIRYIKARNKPEAKERDSPPPKHPRTLKHAVKPLNTMKLKHRDNANQFLPPSATSTATSQSPSGAQRQEAAVSKQIKLPNLDFDKIGCKNVCRSSDLPASPRPSSSPASSSTNPSKSPGQGSSLGEVGYNLYNAAHGERKEKSGLRPIIIDGSNVAYSHSKGKYFSSKGLEMCVNYFLSRKHKVYAFVPLFRKANGQSKEPEILKRLESDGHLIFTPSRMVDNKIHTPYDDRYIVQCATELGGVIVTTDNYRDLMLENSLWEATIKERLLMFTWVEDILIFPLDPLGRNGPALEEFLKFK